MLSKVLNLDKLSRPQIWNIEQEKDREKEKVGGSTVIPVFRFTLRIYMNACTIYILDAHACMISIYDHELKIKLLKSKFECCPVFQL